MEKKKPSWDDIPSLKNLEVDWDFKPENPLGNRSCIRLQTKDLIRILGKKIIPAKILVGQEEFRALLSDISMTGAAFLIDRPFIVGEKIALGFFLGQKKIIGRAVARNCTKAGDKFRVGVEFSGLSENCRNTIQALSQSKGLCD